MKDNVRWYKFQKNVAVEIELLKQYLEEFYPGNQMLENFITQREGLISLLYRALPNYWYLKLCKVSTVRNIFLRESYNNPHAICFNRNDVLDIFEYKHNVFFNVPENVK